MTTLARSRKVERKLRDTLDVFVMPSQLTQVVLDVEDHFHAWRDDTATQFPEYIVAGDLTRVGFPLTVTFDGSAYTVRSNPKGEGVTQ